MAILSTSIETEQAPIYKFNILPIHSAQVAQKTNPNLRSSWKFAGTASGELPTTMSFASRVHEPGAEQRGPVMIARPTGRKIEVQEPEGLDPITLFNTQFNSRRFTTSSPSILPMAEPKEPKAKRKVSFASKADTIPPPCMDLVLYREYGPDWFRLNSETLGAKVPLWQAALTLGLVLMEYLSLA